MHKVNLAQFTYWPTSSLSAAYLSNSLKARKIDFKLDIYPSIINPKQIYRALKKSGEIIAFGCMIDKLPHVLEAAEILKKQFPEKKIILGGNSVLKSAEEILRKFRFVDYVIKGDGCRSLPKLIDNILKRKSDFSKIEGLHYRRQDRVISNLPKYYPDNNYSALYGGIDFKSYKEYLIATSFGCPYRCTFCSDRFDKRSKIIFRDLNVVINEIKRLEKSLKGRKARFFVVDESFLTNRKRVIEFCYLVKKNKVSLKWFCYGRVGQVDEELLKIMANSGCESLLFGVESGSNRILKIIQKGFLIEDATKKLLLSKKYMKRVIAFFVFRFPFETVKDFTDTVAATGYLESKKVKTFLFPLAPVKNSPIYNQYKNDLKFSLKMPCAITSLKRLSKRSISLIRANPEIFCDYYYYDFPELTKINRLHNSQFA